MFPSSYSSRHNSQQPTQDRASSSSTSSSQNPANQSTSSASQRTNSSIIPGGVVYRNGRWRAWEASSWSVGSFRTLEELEQTYQEYSRSGGFASRSVRMPPSLLATEEDRSGAPSRVSQSSIFENSSGRSDEFSAEDRSFHHNAAPYMISPTYANAVRPTVTGRDGNSRSFLNQLSLARSVVGGDSDSLLDQFDNEYRDQEREPHSRHAQ